MLYTMNKTRKSYAGLNFDPIPQIMKSGVQKYNKCMSVCQQHVMRHYNLDISVNLRSKDDMTQTIFQSISRT